MAGSAKVSEPGQVDAPSPSQLDKFKAAAREIGADDDPERFKERVKRIGSAKPAALETSKSKHG